MRHNTPLTPADLILSCSASFEEGRGCT